VTFVTGHSVFARQSAPEDTDPDLFLRLISRAEEVQVRLRIARWPAGQVCFEARFSIIRTNAMARVGRE